MDIEGRSGCAGWKEAAETEEDVERPLSRATVSSVGVDSSSWAWRGKVEAPCRMGFGESLRRLMLGWRGREKLSMLFGGPSGVCRPSEEWDL